jgi:hypothetical protein
LPRLLCGLTVLYNEACLRPRNCQAARLLQVAPRTLRLAAEAGEIEAIHPLPEGPWIFSRAVLSASPASTITERARQNPKHPAVSHPNQQNLFSSITQTDGCSDAQSGCGSSPTCDRLRASNTPTARSPQTRDEGERRPLPGRGRHHFFDATSFSIALLPFLYCPRQRVKSLSR